jgi:hypothetical protein
MGILLFCLIGCRSERTENAGLDSPCRIDLGSCIDNSLSIKLSEIADTIEYIELKTPPDMVVYGREIYLSDNYIFINSKGSILEFSMDGTFICSAGEKGQGPGEYPLALDVLIDEAGKRVGIASYDHKIRYYSMENGAFLHAVPIVDFNNLCIHDSFVYVSKQTNGFEKYRLAILNLALDTLGGIPNTDFFTRGSTIMYTTSGGKPFYTYQGDVYYKGYLKNDTVWKLRQQEYRTHAVINMGKYKSPVEHNSDKIMQNFNNKAGDYYGINRVMEDDRYLYLSCISYWNPEMSNPSVLYNKLQNSGFIIKDEFGKNGFADDITGGPAFWPLIITDKYYVSMIKPYDDLLVKADDYTDATPAFKDFLKNINDDSNTIIILAKCKSK